MNVFMAIVGWVVCTLVVAGALSETLHFHVYFGGTEGALQFHLNKAHDLIDQLGGTLTIEQLPAGVDDQGNSKAQEKDQK